MRNLNEFKERIKKHAGYGHDNELGLLDSLRPYQGFLDRDAQDFIEAIISYSKENEVKKSNQSELIYYIWNACFTIRRIVISTDGPIQRNSIIDNKETVRIEHWVNTIEHVCLKWLSGDHAIEIALPYAKYIMSGYPIADKDLAFTCLFDFLDKSIPKEIPHEIEINWQGHFEKRFDNQLSYILAIEKLENKSKKWLNLLELLSYKSESDEIREESKRILNR